MPKPAVIVVNSHVVRGGVGGRAAVFALERMGFPVWSLPTISLTWHPGHGRSTRAIPAQPAFEGMVADLIASPKLGEVGAVLVGYLGDVGQIEPLSRLVAAAKRKSPARFLYDPNIGDNGAMFQAPELAAKSRDLLMPLADIATPNRFELGWLTDMPAANADDVGRAAARLGPSEVVVTSAEETDKAIRTMLVADGRITTVEQRAIAGAPKGTGDLFAALYLGHRLSGRTSIEAMRLAASAVGRLAERAAASGLDELPLAEGADDFDGDEDAVSLVAKS